MTWYDAEGKQHTSANPNALFDADPIYRQFVREEVMTRLMNDKTQRRFNAKGFSTMLAAPGTYKWFFVDYKPRHSIPGAYGDVVGSAANGDFPENIDLSLPQED
jgi:hypothetical protein